MSFGRYYQTIIFCGLALTGILVGKDSIPVEVLIKTARREWAILVPAWTIVVILLTYFVYFALALYGTPPFTSMSSITGINLTTIG